MAAKPGEYKTVQARILAYAQQIGWKYVARSEAEKRRGFDYSKATAAEQPAEASPYFDDLLDSQVRKLNPKYADGRGAHRHEAGRGPCGSSTSWRLLRPLFESGISNERFATMSDYRSCGSPTDPFSL